MQVNRLKPKSLLKLPPGLHNDGDGLYLQVTIAKDKEQRNRSWIFRYASGRRSHQMGLGSLNDVDLATARQLARDAREQRAQGNDPLQAKARQRACLTATQAKAITFDEAIKSYEDHHQAEWRTYQHAHDWRVSLTRYASPVLGKLDVGSVDTEAVLKVLRPIWQEKTETAMRLRSRIEAVINFAIHDTDRANPARWKGHLEYKLAARLRKLQGVKHMAAMPYADLPAFMGRLRAKDGIGHRALEFVILTAVRSKEVLHARWAEIDLKAKIWTIPKERMKANREHRIALSGPAAELLRRLQPGDGYVFPGEHSSRMGHSLLLRLLGNLDGNGFTVHGFRSSFRQWAAEQTNFPREVVEVALAHVVGDATERAYQRSDLLDKRRALMNDWAQFLRA